MRLKLILIFLSLGYSSCLLAQMHIDFESLDSIVVEVEENAQAFYMHKMLQGETAYSLAKYFKVNFRDLLILNGIEENEILPLGTQLKIPLNLDHLIRSSERNQANDIPVIYQVKKLETLFKISQVYFDQPIENLVVRNKIRKLSLRTGEELLVGWWPCAQQISTQNTTIVSKNDSVQIKEFKKEKDNSANNNIPKAVIVNNEKPSAESLQLENTEEDSIMRVIEPVIINRSGIALWDKADINTESLLVLHKTAQTGSVIKLQNPVTDLVVVAQVVGPIPENVYTDDIDAIVSRSVAQKLGALDTRFQVLMTYYE